MEILGISHYFWSGVGVVIATILAVWGRRLCTTLDRLDSLGCWATEALAGYLCAIIPTIACLVLIYCGIFSLREQWMMELKKEFIVVMYVVWMMFLLASTILLIFSRIKEMPRIKRELTNFSQSSF